MIEIVLCDSRQARGGIIRRCRDFSVTGHSWIGDRLDHFALTEFVDARRDDSIRDVVVDHLVHLDDDLAGVGIDLVARPVAAGDVQPNAMTAIEHDARAPAVENQLANGAGGQRIGFVEAAAELDPLDAVGDGDLPAIGIDVDQVITMYFIGNSVRMRRFVVSGIYDAQLEDIDNHLVVGDIRHAQRLNGWREDQVSGMELFLTSKERLDAKQEEIEEFILEKTSDTDDGVVLKNIHRIYSHLYDWLDLMDINVVVLLTLMVLVAGFNMMSGLLILLFEKTATIGLLKAVGMRDRHIRNSFLYNAAVVAIRGMIAGTVLAVVFLIIQETTRFITLDPASYFVDSVPVDISWFHILTVDVIAVGMLLLILMLPLKSLIRISPDKAIRMR